VSKYSLPYILNEKVIPVNVTSFLGTEPLGRPRRRWEDNIRMNLGKLGWQGVDWSHLAENRIQWQTLINTVINVLVP
jgi:hypothetical protein